MIKREAKATTVFRHWLAKNSRYFFRNSAAFELKQTQKDSILFSAVKDHQLDALCAAASLGISYKIPDDSMGYKPFDLILMRNANAFIVIRYPKLFAVIDVERFLAEREEGKKSLSSERAQQISKYVINL